MSYNRKIKDRQKINNFVAKHDFNKGGVHTKPPKAKRHAARQHMGQIDINSSEEEFEYLYHDTE